MTLGDFIGIIGVAVTLLAYTLLQLRKLSATAISYSFMNALGSVLLLISLYYDWNLAATILEVVWLLMSLYGLTQSLHAYFRHKKHHQKHS